MQDGSAPSSRGEHPHRESAKTLAALRLSARSRSPMGPRLHRQTPSARRQPAERGAEADLCGPPSSATTAQQCPVGESQRDALQAERATSRSVASGLARTIARGVRWRFSSADDATIRPRLLLKLFRAHARVRVGIGRPAAHGWSGAEVSRKRRKTPDCLCWHRYLCAVSSRRTTRSWRRRSRCSGRTSCFISSGMPRTS